MERERPASDSELMRRLAGGDRGALSDLIKRHQQRAMDIAYRATGDRWLAEDVVQEAFLRVWRFAGDYKPRAQFTTWLYRVVINLCLDAFKKRKQRFTYDPGLGGAAEADPSETLESDEVSLKVREAMARLPQRQRLAVVLHRFSGLKLAEIVELTGWTESAVESLLVRGYASLKASLRGQWES